MRYLLSLNNNSSSSFEYKSLVRFKSRTELEVSDAEESTELIDSVEDAPDKTTWTGFSMMKQSGLGGGGLSSRIVISLSSLMR